MVPAMTERTFIAGLAEMAIDLQCDPPSQLLAEILGLRKNGGWPG